MGCAQMNPQNGAWLSKRSVSSFDSELSTPEARPSFASRVKTPYRWVVRRKGK